MFRLTQALILVLAALAVAGASTSAQAATYECREESTIDDEAPFSIRITLSDDQSSATVQFDKGGTVITTTAHVTVRTSSSHPGARVFSLDAIKPESTETLAAVEFSNGSGRGAVEFLAAPWEGWWNYLRCRAL